MQNRKASNSKVSFPTRTSLDLKLSVYNAWLQGDRT